MNNNFDDIISDVQFIPLVPNRWENNYNIAMYKINNNILNINSIYPDEVFDFLHDRIVPGIKPYSYLISNYGRLFSIPYNKFMNYDRDKGRYYRVDLPIYEPNKCIYIKKHFFIHRLTLATFSNTCYHNQLQVNHIDGNIYNNHISNLEWCTGYENLYHMHHILQRFKDRNLSDETVIGVCEDLVKMLPFKEISKKWGVSEYQIYGIKSKRYYKNITQNYTFEQYWERMPDENIHEICQLLENDVPGYIIADKYHCARTTISNIKSRRIRKNIGSNYNF